MLNLTRIYELMKTSLIPTSIFNVASCSLGFAACVPVLAAGLVILMSQLARLTSGSLLALVFSISAVALMTGVLVRALSLAAMVYLARGRGALEWCAPSECATFATWLGCSWSFPGAGGWQAGIRILGLGIALCGTHGSEDDHG